MGSHDSESTFKGHQPSQGVFDNITQTTDLGAERGSTAIPIAQLLSPPSLHEPTTGHINLEQLVVDGDVAADISMLWAASISPKGDAGDKILDSPQALNPTGLLRAQEAFLLQLFRNKLGTWVRALP